MPTGWPDLNFSAKVTFCTEHDVGITGVQVREGTTRELECSKSGGGRWILPCLFCWEQVQLSEEDWRAGQQVRFQFEQQCTLEKTQGKDTVLQREKEMIKMPAPRLSPKDSFLHCYIMSCDSVQFSMMLIQKINSQVEFKTDMFFLAFWPRVSTNIWNLRSKECFVF